MSVPLTDPELRACFFVFKILYTPLKYIPRHDTINLLAGLLFNRHVMIRLPAILCGRGFH